MAIRPSTRLRSTSFTLAPALLAGACGFAPPDHDSDLAGDPAADPAPDACLLSGSPAPLPTECGLFVSSSRGRDGAPGTPASPLRTLTEALARAVPGDRIHACAELFEEALVVSVPVALLGGFDCADGFRRAPSGARTHITAPPGTPAITVASSGVPFAETLLSDLRAVAAPAPDPGASSIALLAHHVAVTLVRTTLVASDGAPGEHAAPHAETASSGHPGAPGAAACTAALVPGAAPASTACDDGLSAGGAGGDGALFFGGDGTAGFPAVLDNHGTGAPPAGNASCSLGTAGAPGAPGSPGTGADSLGILGLFGHAAPSGHDGAPGTRAQGGGGGGGARGGAGPGTCASPLTGGASGGSGGAGGCGGQGGRGGPPGGSSIAIVSLASVLTFEQAVLVAGRGGAGGDGGPGQLGGKGGSGGPGGPASGLLTPACPGGPGGTGGQGGRGGGGPGGHSLGIAFTGLRPSLQGVAVSIGAPGEGGRGHGGDGGVGAGRDGLAAATLEFPP